MNRCFCIADNTANTAFSAVNRPLSTTPQKRCLWLDTLIEMFIRYQQWVRVDERLDRAGPHQLQALLVKQAERAVDRTSTTGAVGLEA